MRHAIAAARRRSQWPVHASSPVKGVIVATSLGLLTSLGVAAAASGAAGAAGGTTRTHSASVQQRVSGNGSYECPSASVPIADTIFMNTHYSFAERAADLVSCMTLAEKVNQLKTNSAPAIPRLGVQQYTYWSEGQHGVNLLGANTNNGGAGGGPHATSFPTNEASTMSWDPTLMYQETTAISNEVRGFLDKSLWGTGQNNIGPSASDYGSLTFWAPTVNMDRDPLWGRTDEAFGEDPYLASAMAGAFVDGYEGNTMSGKSLTGYLKVAATAKHFALNNWDDARHYSSSNTTDANIRDYYTAQFKSLIEDAHVAGLMTSYNAINGTPAPADTYTVNELAQRTYGFKGYITSDCGAVSDIYGSSSHNWAPPGFTTNTTSGVTTWTTNTGATLPGAAGGEAYALRAGTALNCTGSEATLSNIDDAIQAGVLSQGVIDTALTNTFTVRMETGEFNPAGQVSYTKITKSQIQSPANQALAQKMADEDLVLLQNDAVAGTSKPLLPADPSALNNVVIVGNLANTVTLGDYSGDPTLQVNAVQGITAAVHAVNPSATVTYDACGTSTTATTAASCSAATLSAAKTADLVIAFVGTDLNVATEQHDRSSLAMPGNYSSLLSQISAVGNPRTALVIQANGPVDLGGLQGEFPAIVYSGYNGESQGSALADVLFGKVDPAGHLDFTWYTDDSQLAPISNYGLTPSQTGGLGRTYMYFTGKPTYPFGYGLSYTTFAYSHIGVAPAAARRTSARTARAHTTPASVSANGSVRVSFDVTNTGQSAGATVAQLYAAPQFTVSGVELPQEQLAGFRRTGVLRPGQTQHVSLLVKASSLSRWDESSLKEVVYNGQYRFSIGASASDIVGGGTVDITGQITPRVQSVTVQPGQVVYQPGQTLNLKGTNPWIASDTDSSLEQTHQTADHVVEAVDDNEQFVDLSKARVHYWTANPAVATVSPDGVVTMVGHGVTTVDVSVNGVVGSAPIVVQRSIDVTAPSWAAAGSTTTVTTSFQNTGSRPVRNLSLSLSLPAGWSATGDSATRLAVVQPGQVVKTNWTVSIPADAASGANTINAVATYVDSGGQDVLSDSTTLQIPYASLAAAFDNVGYTSASDIGPGNLDGSGGSFDAAALAAGGLTPGAQFIHDGHVFTWPDVQPGLPSDVAAAGQVIAMSGSADRLGVLGTASFGGSSGTGTIVYTDGSTQSYTLDFPDWWSNTNPTNGDIALTMTGCNGDVCTATTKVSLYYDEIPIDPTKTVADVILPDAQYMNIFAMSLTLTPVQSYGSLADAFDNVGITDNSNVAPGNLDDAGRSYSEQSLTAAGLAPGASYSADGVTFTWPDVAAGLPDNVEANGQQIALSGSGNELGFMGSATNSVVSGPGTVIYTDGSSQSFTLSFSDWWGTTETAPSGDQGGTAVTLQGCNDANSGSANLCASSNPKVSVYDEIVPIDPSKTVAAVQLPYRAKLHVFALAVGSSS